MKSTEEIFEPFVRVGLVPQQNNAHAGVPESTGLGLAICRSILLLHQGHIRAENVMPGPGLRVTFDLPLAQAAQAAAPPARV
jgi:two-component system heavy metal sensor histidine kinase CusS